MPTALMLILLFGLLTLWVPARWAVSTFQVALFTLAAIRLLRRRNLGQHPVGWLLASALVWGLLQVVSGQTVDQLTTLTSALAWFTNLVAFALALDLFAAGRARETFFRLLLAFAALLSIVAILTALASPPGVVFWLWPAGTGVPTLGPFLYRNQYAAFVEAILPLAIFGVIRDRQRRVLHAAIAACLFGSVVAGGSRTGAILCLAEIVFIPIAAFLQKRISAATVTRALAVSVAAVATFTAVVGWENLWNRLQETNPYSLRLDLVRSSWNMFQQRPVLGFGLGTWPLAYPGYALFDDGRFVNQAHNDWAQWAVEGGLPFVLLIAAMALWAVRPAWRSLWGIGILSVFVHAFVDYPFQQRPALAAFFFVMLGTLAAERTRRLP
jgi:O-antigen ligase